MQKALPSAEAYTQKILGQFEPSSHRGNVARALLESDVAIDSIYTTPLETHNAMEPHATIAHWEGDQLVGADDPDVIVDGLADALARTGTDALNLRIHVPGVSPAAAREQISALGESVVPRLRAR